MSPLRPHTVYGQPPRDLVHYGADAVQLSPLMPGASALETCPEKSLASAVIYAPPGTIERRYILALALRALEEGAPLTALAPKDKGGNRIAAELERFGCAVTEVSKAHHRIVTTTRPAILTLDTAVADGCYRQVDDLWTQPGIFSWDRLDVGSALLLKHLPGFSGAGADLGCGIGILSKAALASPDVTALTLIDIDRRAIDAARRNIADARAQFLWADVRTGDLPQALDFILMNPPFHDAGIEDQSLGQRFITRAAGMLRPGGQCWLTANRHLPYEALLRTHFSQSRLVADEDGFKIYASVK